MLCMLLRATDTKTIRLYIDEERSPSTFCLPRHARVMHDVDSFQPQLKNSREARDDGFIMYSTCVFDRRRKCKHEGSTAFYSSENVWAYLPRSKCHLIMKDVRVLLNLHIVFTSSSCLAFPPFRNVFIFGHDLNGSVEKAKNLLLECKDTIPNGIVEGNTCCFQQPKHCHFPLGVTFKSIHSCCQMLIYNLSLWSPNYGEGENWAY
jgi:hypothetical protein